MPDRNAEYYFEDIIFQVEDQLFKVHRHLFVELSKVFQNMFKISVPEGADVEGSSDKRPLVLEGVGKKDFIPLLRYLYYPLKFQGDSELTFSLEEWQSILKLAVLYEMGEIKSFAIEKMTPLLTELPSLQIYLAKTYGIKEWLVPGFFRLARRIRPLDEEDVKFTGIPDALKICALREKRRRCVPCESCSRGNHSDGFELTEVCETFGIDSSDLPRMVGGCEESCSCSTSSTHWQVLLKSRFASFGVDKEDDDCTSSNFKGRKWRRK